MSIKNPKGKPTDVFWIVCSYLERDLLYDKINRLSNRVRKDIVDSSKNILLRGERIYKYEFSVNDDIEKNESCSRIDFSLRTSKIVEIHLKQFPKIMLYQLQNMLNICQT